MQSSLFFLILSVLGVVYLWLGKTAGEGVHTHEDYYLSGRKLTILPLMVTILATQLGGAALLGASEEAYTHGWMGILYSGGICAGFVLLGLGVGAGIRKLNVSTLPEIFSRCYNSPSLRFLAATLSIVTLLLILVGQGVATRKFFVSIGFSSPYIFFGFWLVVVWYTVMGGLNAVVKTDMLQAGFILVAFAVVAAYIGTTQADALAVLWQGAVAEPSALHSPGHSEWLNWLLMPMLFMIVGQDMGQRCCAADEAKTVSKATYLAAIVYITFATIPVWIGLLVRQSRVEIPVNGSVLMQGVELFTNPAITAIAAVALLMAIVSTADSLLCAVSANLAMDYGAVLPWKPGSEARMAKIVTLVVGIVAVMASYSFDNVIPLLVKGYSISIYVLFVPILFAAWFHTLSKSVAICSIGASIGMQLLTIWMPLNLEPLWILGAAFVGAFAGRLMGGRA